MKWYFHENILQYSQKTSKDFFFALSFMWRQKAERRVIWVGRKKNASALELQSNQNATDFTGSNINTSQEESYCTLQGLRPGYSTTLRSTCWVQELGSKCAEKSHGEGCGWENWLAYAVLQHVAIELSLHGSHLCSTSPSKWKKPVHVCKRLGV